MEEHHTNVGSCSQVASCTINNSGFFLLISTWKILQNICQIYLVEVAKMAINRPIFVEIDIIKNKTCSKDSYILHIKETNLYCSGSKYFATKKKFHTEIRKNV